MVYLLYGTDDFLLKEELNKIIKKENIDEIDIDNINASECNIDSIINKCNSISLFSSKKCIIVNNCNLFSKSKKNDDETLKLINYLNNMNECTILIFIINDKVDESKLFKKILEVGVIKELNEIKNLKPFIKNNLENYYIDDHTVDLFIKRAGNNVSSIKNYCDILKMYKLEDKIILKEDIINVINESINTDIFKFIDDIILKNKSSAIKTLKYLLKINEEPIKVIALLASKFRLMYQASILSSRGYSEEDIASIYKMKKYPVHLAILNGRKYNKEILLKYLDDLASLDIDIKTGEIDKNTALELFILSL